MKRPGFLSVGFLPLGFVVAVMTFACAGPPDGGAPTVSGTATWRERMLLPPGAMFEATLEDVSRADARSDVIGRTSSEAPTQRMRGVYSYMADSGNFVDCRSGQRLAVAQEGDNAALESAYLKVRPSPGAAVLATVDGRVESRVFMEGPARPTLIVERFVEVMAGHNCSGPVVDASLENTGNAH